MTNTASEKSVIHPIYQALRATAHKLLVSNGRNLVDFQELVASLSEPESPNSGEMTEAMLAIEYTGSAHWLLEKRIGPNATVAIIGSIIDGLSMTKAVAEGCYNKSDMNGLARFILQSKDRKILAKAAAPLIPMNHYSSEVFSHRSMSVQWPEAYANAVHDLPDFLGSLVEPDTLAAAAAKSYLMQEKLSPSYQDVKAHFHSAAMRGIGHLLCTWRAEGSFYLGLCIRGHLGTEWIDNRRVDLQTIATTDDRDGLISVWRELPGFDEDAYRTGWDAASTRLPSQGNSYFEADLAAARHRIKAFFDAHPDALGKLLELRGTPDTVNWKAGEYFFAGLIDRRTLIDIARKKSSLAIAAIKYCPDILPELAAAASTRVSRSLFDHAIGEKS